MGCGCSKNASRVTRTPASTPKIVQNTTKPTQIVNPSNLTPRAAQSASGLNVNRNAVNKIRQDAIKKALGK
jgi:hypothetical protein